MVSREEFEAVKAMAAKAREEQEVLLRRVESLESRLAAQVGARPIERATQSTGAAAIANAKSSLASAAGVWQRRTRASRNRCHSAGGAIRWIVQATGLP